MVTSYSYMWLQNIATGVNMESFQQLQLCYIGQENQ